MRTVRLWASRKAIPNGRYPYAEPVAWVAATLPPTMELASEGPGVHRGPHRSFCCPGLTVLRHSFVRFQCLSDCAQILPSSGFSVEAMKTYLGRVSHRGVHGTV